MRFISSVIMFLLLLAVLVPSGAGAMWEENGILLSSAVTGSYSIRVLADGEGGAYLVWNDDRNGNYDIFAQRIDAWGRELWTPGGVAVCVMNGDQTFPLAAVCDGGGVFIVWTDRRAVSYSDIYGQRLDGDGGILLAPGGVAICTATGNQGDPQVIWDVSGWFFVSWIDGRDGSWDLYSQKLDGAGVKQWTLHGVPVCTQPNTQGGQRMIPDGSGGFVIAWTDQRNASDWNIYMQWIDGGGNIQNAIDGVPVCSAAELQNDLEMVLDGTGTAVCAWEDYRGANGDIYAARFDFEGTDKWTDNGIPVCAAANAQRYIDLKVDSAGDIFFTWYDARSGNSDIYVQKLYINGSPHWAADGIPVVQFPGDQHAPVLSPDGTGGAVIVWYDYRSGMSSDIYAQKIDRDGVQLWDPDGVPLATGTGLQWKPQICPDGQGGAITAWQDKRDGISELVYAQRIERNGWWGYPSPAMDIVRDVPDDQGGLIDVAWSASRIDGWPYLAVESYSVWKSIDHYSASLLLEGGARLIGSPGEMTVYGKADLPESDITDAGLAPAEGLPAADAVIVRSEIIDGASYYWQYITSMPANGYPAYSHTVATEFDSIGPGSPYHYFQVCAHGSDPGMSWTSPPDSGRSVDNLAPAAPVNLMAEQLFSPEGLNLTWDPNIESDIAGYNVYRGLGNRFPTDPENLLAFTSGTEFFDDGWDWEIFYYYKIKAVDIHGNESPWTMTGPGDITGDDPMPVPQSTFLDQNFPNPFNPATTIGFGIKEKGHITLRVYDASGRQVATLIDGSMPAGNYSAEWNGRDLNGSKAASGVYFYRLTTKEFEKTRKMILLR